MTFTQRSSLSDRSTASSWFQLRQLPLCAVLLLLMGCQSDRVVKLASYTAPSLTLPERYKYAELNWVETSKVSSTASSWWQLYQDPVLNQLLQRLNQENLDIQQAAARYRQAYAVLERADAEVLPKFNLSADSSRSGGSHISSSEQQKTALSVSWVPDVWGRIAKATEGQQANVAASQADLAAVQLQQQLLAVQAYWAIRLHDLQLDVLAQTQASYRRSEQILQHQYQAGALAKVDLVQAQSQTKRVEIAILQQKKLRVQQENILAVLMGQAVTDFHLSKQAHRWKLPQIPTQLPSVLLGQRPDIIHAERQLAYVHAELGLAETAWLPDVRISLDQQLNGQTLKQLFQSPNLLWSVGVGAAIKVFDGKQRQAEIDQAQARYQEKLAGYKHSVLNAWKEVEDVLYQSENLRLQGISQQQLLDLALANEQMVLQRYRAGLVSYLEVVASQNSRLEAEQALLELDYAKVSQSAQLIAALGGQWS